MFLPAGFAKPFGIVQGELDLRRHSTNPLQRLSRALGDLWMPRRGRLGELKVKTRSHDPGQLRSTYRSAGVARSGPRSPVGALKR
ncbi:MAG: hypothetical protein ACK2TZ_06355, partial [Anaerolineales bacterium]